MPKSPIRKPEGTKEVHAMSGNDTERLAERIARSFHAGQYRRDGTTPYIWHIEGTVNWLRRHGALVDELAAGWLHDVIEDTNATEDSLHFAGVPSPVLDAVVALTKANGEDYELYLRRVAANPIARIVKIADMINNLSDSPTREQVRKYSLGLSTLTQGWPYWPGPQSP